jgi:Raf kinase inhibitor-like YbhB/YbcL family protein
MDFTLASSAFRGGGTIPQRFTGEGEDLSPPLRWQGVPEGTQSFALVVDDPDAPRGTFTHWTVFGLPGTATELPEGWSPGQAGTSGRNDFGREGYGGPMPPPGHGPHRYFFHLYALDVPRLPLREGASRQDLEHALEGHVLGTAELMGRYERGGKRH